MWVWALISAAPEFIAKHWKPLLVAGLLFGAWWYHSGAVKDAREAGYKAAVSDINAEAKRLDQGADAAAARVEACFRNGGTWNRGKGKCEKAQ